MESLFGDAALEVEDTTIQEEETPEETPMAIHIVPSDPAPAQIVIAKPDPVEADPELTLVKSYLDIEEGRGLCATAEQDNFKAIKGVCTSHGLHHDAERFDTHMTQLAKRYMADRWDNPHGKQDMRVIGSHARKNNVGDWSLRKFRVPLRLRPQLDENQISYTEKEFTSKRTGEYTALVINGVPDGFYTAWKTVTRAIDHGVVGWQDMAKSEIDKAIKELKGPAQTKSAKQFTTEELLDEELPAFIDYMAKVLSHLPEPKLVADLVKGRLDTFLEPFTS